MKKPTLAIFSFILLSTSLLFLQKNNTISHPPLEINDPASGAYEALRFNGERLTYPSGTIPANAHYDAWKKLQMPVAGIRTGNPPNPWETIGPHNRGGRTLALAINPENPNTMYAGSASGGLWRSHSGGMGVQAWSRIETGLPVLGVSCITLSPVDTSTIYIGTGEVYNYFAAGTGAAYRSTRGSYGMGILKSTDNGQTWEKSLDWSYQQERGIWQIKIDPNDANIIYAATTEGVYKSTDAGDSWTQMLDVIMANDLLINTSNTNEIVVGCGNFGTPEFGIHKSTDGGTTWQKITSNLPQDFLGKIQLGASASSPNIIYASIGNGFGFDDGATWLCRSDDFGTTWTVKNQTDYSLWQGWFAHDVAVSPTDPDYLVAIGIEVWVSEDGGDSLRIESFGGIGFVNPPIEGPDGEPDFVHSDCHEVVFHPTNPNIVYIGSDGGIHRSEDGGQTFHSASGAYQTAQFYNGTSTSANDDNFFIGGLQDNGTIRWNGDLTWQRVWGGDGSWTAIHPIDDDIFFVSSQRLNMRRTQNGGSNFNFAGVGNAGADPVAFIAPYVIAPSQENTLYAGSALIARSDNLGFDWTTLNNGQPLDGNPILSMEVSPENEDVLYLATAPLNGVPSHVYVTTDGESFQDITGTNLPDRYPMDITVDPTDEATAYITYSGFGTGHVFKTIDYGATWEDISETLPDVPTNAVIVDPIFPNNVYVGNDLGVFVSLDGGGSWDVFQEGLPEVTMVFDLKINPTLRKLRMATHGNGAYQRDLFDETFVDTEDIVKEKFKLQISPNPASSMISIAFNNIEKRSFDIQLINNLGQVVRTIHQGILNKGEQKLETNISDLSAGIYFVKITTNNFQLTEQLVIQ